MTGFQRISFLILIALGFYGRAIAQAPSWFPGPPEAGLTGSLTIPVNYGISGAGTVYITIQNFNDPTIFTSAEIKSFAIASPSGTRVATATIPVLVGDINKSLQIIVDVINSNRNHTINIVAEGSPGGLQAAPVRLTATTLSCPGIDILTGFTQPVKCVNKGAVATFNVVLIDPPNSGIIKGTTWFIDWGDGTTASSFPALVANILSN